MSRTWNVAFRWLYRLLGWLDPLIRGMWHAVGFGNVIELRVRSRRSGRDRRVLLGLLRAGGQLYLGHPNGECGWTRDLAAAGEGRLVPRSSSSLEFRPVRLGTGAELEAVIRATNQHPFPGNLMYRLAQGHIRVVGVYFRLEPLCGGLASSR